MASPNGVLIESDWNLKTVKFCKENHVEAVLIESDWNLKKKSKDPRQVPPRRINRIRLEFKVSIPARVTGMLSGINRIRLEFKAIRNTDSDFRFVVLIESDWNLKTITPAIIKIVFMY